MKLRTKIQMFSTIFMLLLVVLINASIYYLFYQRSVQDELNYLINHTYTIVEVLHENEQVAPTDLLHAFVPQNGMIRIIAEDEEAPLFAVARENDYRNMPYQFSRREVRTVQKNDEGIYVATILRPIVWADGQVVTLEVTDHLYTLHETMKTLFYVLTIASLLIILPTVIASMLLGRFILQPIKVLTNTMKENMKHGKWKKTSIQNRSKDELYMMEMTFNELIDALKDAFEKQEMFVSNASHELKTPLSIIKSYAQLLKRRGKDHPQIFDEAVSAIDSEADRMQRLVEQLLLLAKNENRPSFQTVDLVQIAKKVIKQFSGAYDRELKLMQTSSSLSVKGDPEQLKQLIYILIDNALKYSDEEVHIHVFSYEQKVILQVVDFGEGIPAEKQPYIFARFYRLDESRSRETGGTGLGLAIAQAIAKHHHGILSVKSESGKGSTFTFTLPLKEENE